jgi:hypothetical protein
MMPPEIERERRRVLRAALPQEFEHEAMTLLGKGRSVGCGGRHGIQE